MIYIDFNGAQVLLRCFQDFGDVAGPDSIGPYDGNSLKQFLFQGREIINKSESSFSPKKTKVCVYTSNKKAHQ